MEKVLCIIQVIMFVLKLIGYLKISWLTVFIPGIINLIYTVFGSLILTFLGLKLKD